MDTLNTLVAIFLGGLLAVGSALVRELMDRRVRGPQDLVEALGQMLCTEEGDTVATALVSLKDSAEKIATQLEMQNKILVKIFGALKPAAPATA